MTPPGQPWVSTEKFQRNRSSCLAVYTQRIYTNVLFYYINILISREKRMSMDNESLGVNSSSSLHWEQFQQTVQMVIILQIFIARNIISRSIVARNIIARSIVARSIAARNTVTRKHYNSCLSRQPPPPRRFFLNYTLLESYEDLSWFMVK